MWWVRALSTLLVVGALCGCTGPDDPSPGSDPAVPGEAADERGPTRALREASREGAERSAVTAHATPDVVGLSITPIDVGVAEDGRGAMVPTSGPVALDIRRPDGWPGRALDPELTVGELVFRQYVHVDAEILRFAAAERASLDMDAYAFVQWGDDESSRIEVMHEATPAPAGGLAP